MTQNAEKGYLGSSPSQEDSAGGGKSTAILAQHSDDAQQEEGLPTTATLRAVLDMEIATAAATGAKLSMKDLTVLAPQNDPFRLDTPARHRDGEWLPAPSSNRWARLIAQRYGLTLPEARAELRRLAAHGWQSWEFAARLDDCEDSSE